MKIIHIIFVVFIVGFVVNALFTVNAARTRQIQERGIQCSR